MKFLLFAVLYMLVEVGSLKLFTKINGGQDLRENVLASVREYPYELHRCSATFLTQNFLVAPAKCVYCGGNCSLFVLALSTYLSAVDNEGKAIEVAEVFINPDFYEEPKLNDVGLIKLKNKVPKAHTFALPHGLPVHVFDAHLDGAVYFGWEFSSNKKEYYLHSHKAKIVSNAMCSVVLREFVECNYLCAQGESPIMMGSYDYGVPLTATAGGKKVVLGMYTRDGLPRETRAEIFLSLTPYVQWISKVVNGIKREEEEEPSAYPNPQEER